MSLLWILAVIVILGLLVGLIYLALTKSQCENDLNNCNNNTNIDCTNCKNGNNGGTPYVPINKIFSIPPTSQPVPGSDQAVIISNGVITYKNTSGDNINVKLSVSAPNNNSPVIYLMEPQGEKVNLDVNYTPGVDGVNLGQVNQNLKVSNNMLKALDDSTATIDIVLVYN